MVEEAIESEEAETLETMNGVDAEQADYSTTIETAKRRAEAESITTSEQEEKRTFVITGVYHVITLWRHHIVTSPYCDVISILYHY